MLNFLRKNTKIIILFIVGSFGIWGIGSIALTGFSGGTAAGKVYGKKISVQEFNRHLKIVQIFEGESAESKDPSFLENKAWQQIALAMKARRQGIKVSDEEVREEIFKRMQAPQGYSEEMYNRWVQNVFREGPRAFEEKIRDVIAIRKLLDQLQTEAVMTDEELKKKYFAAHPDSKPEDFEKVKSGFRLAMTEIAMRKKREEFIQQVIQEANIQNFLEEERKAKEQTAIQTQVPGSVQPLSTPVPLPATSKEGTSARSKSD